MEYDSVFLPSLRHLGQGDEGDIAKVESFDWMWVVKKIYLEMKKVYLEMKITRRRGEQEGAEVNFPVLIFSPDIWSSPMPKAVESNPSLTLGVSLENVSCSQVQGPEIRATAVFDGKICISRPSISIVLF